MKRQFILSISIILCAAMLASCGSAATFKDHSGDTLSIEKCQCMFEEPDAAGSLEPIYVYINMDKEKVDAYVGSQDFYTDLIYIATGDDGYKMYLEAISVVTPESGVALIFRYPSGEGWDKDKASQYFQQTKLYLYWPEWTGKQVDAKTCEHIKIELPTVQLV